MARAIVLFLAKRLGLARVSKFETRPATNLDFGGRKYKDIYNWSGIVILALENISIDKDYHNLSQNCCKQLLKLYTCDYQASFFLFFSSLLSFVIPVYVPPLLCEWGIWNF
jgi:hypothetical protein